MRENGTLGALSFKYRTKKHRWYQDYMRGSTMKALYILDAQ